MFKIDKKKLILTKIKLYRERGASYSEISKALNDEKIFTLIGNKWRPSYLFTFYTKNKQIVNI